MDLRVLIVDDSLTGRKTESRHEQFPIVADDDRGTAMVLAGALRSEIEVVVVSTGAEVLDVSRPAISTWCCST